MATEIIWTSPSHNLTRVTGMLTEHLLSGWCWLLLLIDDVMLNVCIVGFERGPGIVRVRGLGVGYFSCVIVG